MELELDVKPGALSKENSFPKDMIEKIFESFQVFSTKMVKSYVSEGRNCKDAR